MADRGSGDADRVDLSYELAEVPDERNTKALRHRLPGSLVDVADCNELATLKLGVNSGVLSAQMANADDRSF